MRGGDCEDGSCDAHVSAYSILKLDSNAKGVDDSVRALLYLASLYCPFLIESAINFGRHVTTEFSRYNAMPTDPIHHTSMCLHLYFKLLPWPLVQKMIYPLKLSRVKEYSSRDQLDEVVDSESGIRAGIDPRAKDLPVLVVEPTDHNQTNWSKALPNPLSKKVLAAVSRLNLPNRVASLYPATSFDEEKFYLWDIFGYSKPLFELTGQKTPYWGFVANDTKNVYGVPPVGLLNRHLSARLRPGPTLHSEWTRLADVAAESLPLIPPFEAPEEETEVSEKEREMVLMVRPGGRWETAHGQQLATALSSLRPPLEVTQVDSWELVEGEKLEVWHLGRGSEASQ